ncbi:MAG: CooT family nickel-binding protein [Methanotrichaceae archaeon]|nr:CooT family nickel-binding protein [Methanotrichaceae archaeon]
MCELSVYMVDGEQEDLLMDGVVHILVLDDEIIMEGILGESKRAKGRLVEVDITRTRAMLKPA